MPYTLDPVSSENFYNREKLLERLKNPEGRSRSLVISARRMGKTSLLKELERQITDETGHVAIYISLQLIPTQDDLPRLLISRCREQAAYFQSRGFDIAEFKGEENFFKLLGDLDGAMRLDDKYLFLLVDEAGKMANYESSFWEQLQGTFDMYSKIKWILTDSQPIYRLGETQSDFLREFAPYIYLTRLEKDSSIAFIRQSKRDTTVEVKDEVAEEIYQKTGGHPYLLQMLCSHLYKDGRLNDITVELFDDAYKECNDAKIFNEAYKLLKPIEKQLFLRLPIHEMELRRLASGWGTYEETLKVALKELLQLGYVKKQEDEPYYLPPDDFWSRWIDENHQNLLSKLEAGVTTPATGTQEPKEEVKETSAKTKEAPNGKDRWRNMFFSIINTVTVSVGVLAILSFLLNWRPIQFFVVPTIALILLVLYILFFLRKI